VIIDDGYDPLRGEIELWKEKGSSLPSMSGRSWTKGEFVLTNIRLLFIRSFDPPYMKDRKSDHILWQLMLEDIIDVSTFKPSSLIPLSVRINTMDSQYILNLNGYSSKFLMDRIVNTFNRYVVDEEIEDETIGRKPIESSKRTTLNDFTGDREIPHKRVRPPIPENCYACGSPLNPGEIFWLERNIFQCPSCGSRMKIE
jgi:hypothetical protein